MKILIGSLLFATAIFINFPELNSSPHPSSEAGPSHANFEVENIHPDPIVSRHVYIRLYNQEIEVDLARIGNRYEAVQCKVIHPRFKIPSLATRSGMNFMTQADFKKVQGGTFIRIVIYVHENEHRVRNLLGAKLPPPGRDVYQKGDPRNLNPDHTKWFITYKGVDFEVEVEPISQNLVDIKPYNRRNKRPSEQVIKDHWHEIPYIYFGGVYFLVFKSPRNTVVGAALDPFWLHRPREEFVHVNPHVNPQIRPQTYRPIDPNPEPEETFDQQHYLEQYHLLDQQYNFDQHHHTNQQQSLYQDPYHYPYQTFDPNQNAYHQETLEPSQVYPQQSGFHTPRFHLNQNWHYPPHYPPNP